MMINSLSNIILRKNRCRMVVALVFVFCLFLPVVSRLVLRLPQLTFANFTDSVFYLSYSQSFQELFLRHGFIYYASRFGAILPDAIAFNLVGPMDGPIILRMTLACLVSGALFWIGKKYFDLDVGIFASALWSFQPVFARLFCTTYLDSTAVPFLILAAALILIFQNSVAVAFFSGILFALSVTSHLYIMILSVLLVPLIIGWRFRTLGFFLRKQSPWFVGGFIFSITCAYYWYAKNCGIGAFWQPTVELMSDMSKGATNLWKKNTLDALLETPLWFAPFPFLLWGVFYWKKTSIPFRGAWITLLLSTGFFWAGDLMGGAYALSMPFYFSFLCPVLILFLISFYGELRASSHNQFIPWLLLIISFVVSCLPMIVKAQTKIPWTITILAMFLAVLLLLWRVPNWNLKIATALGCLLAFSTLTLGTGFYSQFLAGVRIRTPHDHKLPAIALKIKQMLPPATEGDVIRFWYPEAENQPLRMLQSFFLHTFSLLPGGDGFAKYPEICVEDAEAIRQAGVEQVVVMDNDATRIWNALSSIEQTGIKFSILQSMEFPCGKEIFYFKRLLLETSEIKSAWEIPISSVNFFPEAGMALNKETCFLTTSDKRNSKRNFDFWVSLDEANSQPNAVILKSQVFHGRVDAFLLADDGKVVSLTEIWPTSKPVSRTLYTGKNTQAKKLMIRNKMPDSSISKIKLLGIHGAQVNQ